MDVDRDKDRLEASKSPIFLITSSSMMRLILKPDSDSFIFQEESKVSQ